jgi:D-lactate dehydrogenase
MHNAENDSPIGDQLNRHYPSMNAIAYNIQAEEKEHLVRANAKRHKLTLISNELNAETSAFSAGKEVVIISESDTLNATLLAYLKKQGVQKIITRSHSTEHIDREAAKELQIQICKLRENISQEEGAWEIIDLLSS